MQHGCHFWGGVWEKRNCGPLGGKKDKQRHWMRVKESPEMQRQKGTRNTFKFCLRLNLVSEMPTKIFK